MMLPTFVLLASIEPRQFEDKVSLYEAHAIFYAALGDKKAKEKSLKKLKKEARKLKLPFGVLAENIERRISGEPILPLRS